MSLFLRRCLRLRRRIRTGSASRLSRNAVLWASTPPAASAVSRYSRSGVRSGVILLVAIGLLAQVVLAALLGHASAASRANAASAPSARAGAPAAGRWVGLSSLQTGGASATPATSVPQLDHVFTIVMENHTYSEIIGDTADAPYINNTLIPSGALATNYDAVTHPSLPNYIALTAGSTLGISTDCDPSSCSVSGPNIAGATLAAGKTWKAYEESMPSNCAQSDAGEYAVRHNPFAYFTNLPSCATNDVPYSKLSSDLSSASKTPNYVFITPNLIDDMHDGTIADGDAWLKANVPTILNSPAFTQQRSLLVITWDEDDNNDVPNQVVTIFLGSGITPGTQDGTAYTHYSLLKTTEQALGLGSLTSNDANATPMAAMFSASSPTPTPSPTATATASPSPTATATATATAPPTSTATPSPTASPTASPSPPPSGTLFADNFETDTLGAPPRGWTVVNGAYWTVQPDGGAVLQQGDPDTSQLYTIKAGSSAWTDYTVQASVKPGANDLSQTSDIMARYTDDNNHYSLLLKNDSEWYLGMRSGGTWTTFAQGSFPYANQFYTLALTVNGSTISAAINGSTVATVKDSTLSSGQIAFSTSATSELDNVLVRSLGAVTPTPTPVPPTPTTPSTPTPTPAPSAPCAEVVNGALTVGSCGGTFTAGSGGSGTPCVENVNNVMTLGKCSGTFTPSGG